MYRASGRQLGWLAGLRVRACPAGATSCSPSRGRACMCTSSKQVCGHSLLALSTLGRDVPIRLSLTKTKRRSGPLCTAATTALPTVTQGLTPAGKSPTWSPILLDVMTCPSSHLEYSSTHSRSASRLSLDMLCKGKRVEAPERNLRSGRSKLLPCLAHFPQVARALVVSTVQVPMPRTSTFSARSGSLSRSIASPRADSLSSASSRMPASQSVAKARCRGSSAATRW